MRIVFCTCPRDLSDVIAEAVLCEKLVACVNIIGEVKSKYWWNGEINTDIESLLIMKTRDDLVDSVIQKIKEVHTYQVPEIISIEIKEGNTDYLEWIKKETQ